MTIENMKKKLHPQIKPLFPDNTLAQGFALSNMTAARDFYTTNRQKLGTPDSPPAGLEHDIATVTSYDGAHIELRIAKPENKTKGPCVLWMHGGGYVMGEARFDDALLFALAQQLDIIAASVEYRLAPEHPFPAPIEDAWHALLYLASRHDVDESAIAIERQRRGWHDRCLLF
jgi:Esterase/lipase